MSAPSQSCCKPLPPTRPHCPSNICSIGCHLVCLCGLRQRRKLTTSCLPCFFSTLCLAAWPELPFRAEAVTRHPSEYVTAGILGLVFNLFLKHLPNFGPSIRGNQFLHSRPGPMFHPSLLLRSTLFCGIAVCFCCVVLLHWFNSAVIAFALPFC